MFTLLSRRFGTVLVLERQLRRWRWGRLLFGEAARCGELETDPVTYNRYHSPRVGPTIVGHGFPRISFSLTLAYNFLLLHLRELATRPCASSGRRLRTIKMWH